MGYSSEVVIAARKKLAEAKSQREALQAARLQSAYAAVPELKNLDRQLRTNMVMAAQAAFSQGGQETLSLLRQENTALQQKRQALLDANFPKEYLDETPLCPLCGGAGYVGSNMCACLQELCRQEQLQSLSVLQGEEASFDHFRLDYYPDRVDPNYGASPRAIMTRNFHICKKYAEDFSPAGGNLLFVGGTGLGKTFLSACIARAVADKGFSVAYETSAHLMSKLEKHRFNPDDQSREETEKIRQCDLLIIDDLGTEMPGNFVTAALYTLVNDRLLAGKAMVISTNLNVEEAARRYSPQIASRLQGSFTGLTFVGEDIRVKKNRGY